MRHEHWVRFTWQLAGFPASLPHVPKGYEIRPAALEDAEELRQMVMRSFVLDPAWNAAIHEVTPLVNGWLDRAFGSDDAVVLALRHGTRIIGASVVLNDNDSNLAPGPCVLLEYRNRGFGTRMLAHSLALLREKDAAEATAITKSESPAARFLYPKFDSIAVEHDFAPLKAA